MASPVYTKESIKRAIRRFVRENGRVPTSSEWTKASGWPPSYVVINRFGTWNAAIEYSGYTPRPALQKKRGRKIVNKKRHTWSQETIIQAALAWEQEHGKRPSYRDWEKGDPKGLRPVSKIVNKHFGRGFNEAMDMIFKLTVNRDGTVTAGSKKLITVEPVSADATSPVNDVVTILMDQSREIKALKQMVAFLVSKEENRPEPKKSGISSLFSVRS